MKLQNGALLLGVDPAFAYHTSVQKLLQGNVIVCDTHGVKEAMNEGGEMYGADRLTRIEASNHEHSARHIHTLIFHDIEKFVGKEPQVDDMTLVVGKFVWSTTAIVGDFLHLTE